ncbi:MAG: glycosyltransferase family 39 protein [Candidatus Bathyarchaeota archaeon]|jgi:4-amino-4-deoxy-L-arabinose transferase-like glycosyltransferase|nr:glycosyltransferase family 39 protein [Candidatus Bathyarchaeota archaeon]MDD4325352.1 glycosyltransferase family 39 protein [Candidatus Bathyarchaeota archaeon]MDI9576594.1 glycosyltransferase family 39 protein [Thermoproteota archaeon]NLD66441.1 phospholipid carrier-dependent glycosyltransferase [Thermoproteota archaeon]
MSTQIFPEHPIKQRFTKSNFKKTFSEYYPLLSILIGFVIVAIFLGPYNNGDTAWEYEAATGVLEYGLPYANGAYLIDQPPIGFYIQALFFKIFGLSFEKGTLLVMFFGLGCIVLVHEIGRLIYNKVTGYFAALLFAFSPWHLILSRSFLIDTQCLFFSLLSLMFGIMAIRRSSFRLFVLSGIIFAVAFTTKLYAIFVLIPLAAFFFYYRIRRIWSTLKWWVAFALPVILTSLIWYIAITEQGIKSIIMHTDFYIQSPLCVESSYFFIANFVINYGLGWFFVDAILLSLIIGLVDRWLLGKFILFDMVCITTIMVVLGIDAYLGVTLNLKAPYLNAIKYCYQALPFFALLAASLMSKSFALFSLAKTRKKLYKTIMLILASVGSVLVIAALLYNLYFTNLFSTWDYIIFRVEPNVNWGYSLFNSVPISVGSLQMTVQNIGFIFALSGILWFNRGIIRRFLLKAKETHRNEHG